LIIKLFKGNVSPTKLCSAGDDKMIINGRQIWILKEIQWVSARYYLGIPAKGSGKI
jgi:hypothetical protein